MNKITIEEIGKEILNMVKGNNEYVENPNQMSKYHYAKGFFIKYLRENDGKLQTYENKGDINNGLTFTKNVIYLKGIDLWRFANSLRFASALTIDTTSYGQVCVSLTIPNVYTKEVK